MERDKAIIITGAAGFIGSILVGCLNHLGYYNIIIVDDFSRADKLSNWADKKFAHKVERTEL
ncbi:MAG: NAD-dependent epimerase/dehydratase family protein, partial [Sphingobacteriales bacterium]